MILKDIKSLIMRHTCLSTEHLTPEIKLRLITPCSELWRSRAEDLPIQDPFWGFYWPGGQAIARYILDKNIKMEDKTVLDIGCGCGAVSIAAAMVNAKRVIANDIDLNALVATKLNASINGISSSHIETSAENFIGSSCKDFDIILLGDMFYDEDFANKLFIWLRNSGKMVILGDPGRHGLTKERRKYMKLLAKYHLPENSCLENHGFYDTSVWRINK